jgi:large subunit ribosomal protein L10
VAKKRAQKQTEVEQLRQDLLRVSSLVLTNFQGLTVQQDTELRRAIQSAGGKYCVVKNTLARIASQGTPAETLLKQLKGVNSIAFTEGDPVALTKVLTKYAKDNPSFSFRAGIVEGRVLSVEEFQALAALPSREEVFAKLLGLLQAPAQRLVSLLSAPGRQLAVAMNQGVKENKFPEAPSSN